MNKAAAALAVLVVMAAVPVSAIAQAYPVKTVRVVIPWPAGGSNDVVGRIVMQKLSESLGQQFVVDNRGGAAGSIGADIVAKAPGDGYTIMVHSTTHVGNAHLYGKKLTYDTLKDFTGIGMLSAQPGVLTVHPSLPVKTPKEFIALAKSRPGQINYSSSGNGSAPHLQMALLISMTGIDITHVPYKGGAPQVTALLAGETQASFATVGTVINHIRGGKLRPLGLGSKTIIDKLNAEINKALVLPDVVKSLENQALDAAPSTVDQFNTALKVDYEKYGKLIKLTGAKIE